MICPRCKSTNVDDGGCYDCGLEFDVDLGNGAVVQRGQDSYAIVTPDSNSNLSSEQFWNMIMIYYDRARKGKVYGKDK